MTEVVDVGARRQAFIDGLFFRVVACSFLEVVIFATALSSGLPLTSFTPPMVVVAGVGSLDLLYWYAGKRRGFPLGDFYVHWIIDLLGISFTIYSLGGLDVPYGPFIYSMIVITSATFMSRTGSYVIAGSAALCLSAIIFFFMNAYLAGTLSDQLKMAKGEIEGHNRLLEQRVQERTRELEARTLQLQDRTDELEELVHIVTHDLQNVAVASTETARKLVDIDGAQLSKRGQRYADRLIRDCRLMTTMLRNLLEVVSQTEVAEPRELVDVNAVVRDAVGRAHTAIESKGIEVVIVGDKTQPRIEISGEAHNGTIDYIVHDNGIGIAENQIGRIFQLYHRAPEQSVAGVVQQGYGIGLAVVKRIVQRYGGRIWVESVEGEGSSFHLSLPRGDR